MTSTSTDALTATTPGFTTQTTPLHLPRFTPGPGCVNASNIFYETDECSWGTGIGLYKPDTHTCTFFGIDAVRDEPNNDCLPGNLDIATECPVQYTVASTWDWEKSNGETTREIYCCPTVYDFKWRGMATLTDNRGSSASLTISSCVARQPSFAGSPPWALNISYWSSSGNSVVRAGTTAEFDPETDKLVASAATIGYVINKRGSTCVPDCSTPYTGGLWPPPNTGTSSTQPVNDSPLRGIEDFIYIIIGILVGVTLLCTGCCIWDCRRRKKKERAMARRRALETVTEDPGAIQMGSVEGARKAD
ncbi:hypothetical protein NCS55_01369300 [Fusarium keratoplasticum]|nr:hypothetical protein NCS55_01369300 [Fusarium keratoplasticum]